MIKSLSFAGVVIALALRTTPSFALDLLTWNTEQGSAEAIARKLDKIEALGQEIRGKTKSGELPEIAVLDEVTSYVAAASVARALGYKDATVAVSDSGSDKDIWPLALEVAIVTPRKVISVTSYQSKADENSPPFVLDLETGELSSGTVKKMDIPAEVGVAADEFVPRAILRVELDGGVVVYGVHLNSSGLGFCRLDDLFRGAKEIISKAEAFGLGDEAARVKEARDAILAKMPIARDPGIEETKQETLRRARSREAAVGAIAKLAAADIAAGRTVLVAGDFNTPLVEECKTGTKIDEDFEPPVGCNTGQTPKTCGGTDGFDDTYSILTSGLIDGVSFKVLTSEIGGTYVGQGFADSPIDNVLIAGAGSADNFEAVKLGTLAPDGTVYGSDHHPVLVQQQ